ncbi:MAG: putative toxin-antitoxin system toxin component, PIN family [Pseudomonadota bacterium]|nr:putative toxin-antitoxin system toxin component, PIN family [Pseudomonadota bacterium]
MPPSAVVDTSVLVSAFLFPDSVPGRVLGLADQGAYALHVSPIILEELRRSLRNPRLRQSYAYTDEKIDAWCAGLNDIGGVIRQPLPDIGSVCRDPDDDHVIAAALIVKADYIVTGDRDLLTLGHYQTVRILTARAFLDELIR